MLKSHDHVTTRGVPKSTGHFVGVFRVFDVLNLGRPSFCPKNFIGLFFYLFIFGYFLFWPVTISNKVPSESRSDEAH